MKQVMIPDISTTLNTVVIRRWLRHEGERVARGEPIVEVETDKAAVEIEAHADGTLLKILVEEGSEVPIGTVIAFIGEPGQIPFAEPTSPTLPARPDIPTGLHRAFPAAEKLARELGVDLRTVKGTGPDGLITPRDVREAAKGS